VIARADAEVMPSGAWSNPLVAERQDAAYRDLIAKMRAGEVRRDLQVAAEALRLTRLADPSVLEVGCGSGYYVEILSHLLSHPLRYLGVDCSPAMIELARKRYPHQRFVLGDATDLPFPAGAFDAVLNGVSLMHVVHYEAAIAEGRRVARRWCILHTVPVLQRRETAFLRKKAYGEWAVEVVFSEAELRSLLAQNGLVVRHVLDSIAYDLEAVLGEATTTKTYVCEVAD
jgi:ubiquinone/menaquinone biosynthesis C-methylase UbiE